MWCIGNDDSDGDSNMYDVSDSDGETNMPDVSSTRISCGNGKSKVASAVKSKKRKRVQKSPKSNERDAKIMSSSKPSAPEVFHRKHKRFKQNTKPKSQGKQYFFYMQCNENFGKNLKN